MQNNTSSCVEMFMKNTGLDIYEAAELYTVFVLELNSEIEELKSSFYNVDFENTQKIAHNIKGISSNYLAMRVYEIAQEIDSRLKKSMIENIDLKISSLENEVDNIYSAILAFFENKGIVLEV